MRGALSIALVLTIGGGAAGTSRQDPQTTFKSGTELVEVDVRVAGRDGRSVSGLSRDDFEILEDGIPHDIQTFYLVDGGLAKAAADVPAAATAPPPAARQTWIFFFDTAHLTASGLSRGRDAVVQFIRERFRDGDLAGIVADGRMIGNRLTSVREELEQAAAAVKMPGNLRSRQLELREWPRLRDEHEAIRIAANDRELLAAAVRRACEDDPGACRGGAPIDTIVREKAMRLAQDVRTATLSLMNVLNVLCSGLARVPGPKAIAFLSDGFVVESMEEQMRLAAGQAARAGARFYTIDARGLNRGGGAGVIDQRNPDDLSGAARFDTQADGMTSLAVDTGGMAIRNENDFARALNVIAQDSGTYYVLGYRPANNRFDGKYRRIDVKIKQPGLTVRARRGYLALEPARMWTAAPVPAAPPGSAPPGETVTTIPGARGMPPMDRLGTTIGSPDAAAHGAGEAPAAAPTTARVRADADRMVLELAGDESTVTASSDVAGQGWAAYQRGDTAAAARLLADAAHDPAARPWVRYALGFSLMAERDARGAAASWEEVRKAAPDFTPVYFDLADAYLQLQDEASAVAVLRTAEARWPSNAEVHNALGVVQIRRGALDDAIETFQKAVQAAPEDSLGYFNLGRAHHMRYFKSHRYVQTQRRWVGNESDREKATAYFQKYIEMGGPYVQQARDALAALGWR